MNEFEQTLKDFGVIIREPSMRKLYAQAYHIAPTNANILIIGDSGTGKDFLAKYIHQNSTRAQKPFVHVNCSAIPADLFESEFFGYEGGAFTGAKSSGHKGLVAQAAGGTLFLDEIGELEPNLQTKLLLLVQEHRIHSLGTNRDTDLDIRIISATNRQLMDMVKNGAFRLDLYYRLNVVSFSLPPLSERPKDLLAILHHLSETYQNQYHCRKTFSADAIEYLQTLPWHGNIREVQNLLEKLYVMEEEELITEKLLRENYRVLRL